MNNEQFTIILQTILEKKGIKKELSEIQKIVDDNMIEIVPKLETTNLKNDLQSISNEITQILNNALGEGLTFSSSDMFQTFNQELSQISATTTQIATELEYATEQLGESLNNSSNVSVFDDIISKILKLKSLNLSDVLNSISKNLD